MAKTPRLNYADASNPGLLSAGAQVIPGVKDFSNGLKLSGNLDALSVYDEGVFTPSLSRQTASNLSVSYSAQYGFYVRVGRLVTYTIDLRLSNVSVGSSSGVWMVMGLPFACSTQVGGYAAPLSNIALYGWTFTTQPMANINHGNTFISLLRLVSNNAIVALDDPGNASMVFLTGSYFV